MASVLSLESLEMYMDQLHELATVAKQKFPHSEFGEVNLQSALQMNIMKFLVKLDEKGFGDGQVIAEIKFINDPEMR